MEKNVLHINLHVPLFLFQRCKMQMEGQNGFFLHVCICYHYILPYLLIHFLFIISTKLTAAYMAHLLSSSSQQPYET